MVSLASLHGGSTLEAMTTVRGPDSCDKESETESLQAGSSITLGPALSRAKEYTADNYAYAVAPDGIQGITMLSGGKYLYGQVDGRKFAERAANDGGFFIWLVNAFSSHPVQTKRHQALYDRKRAGRIL